MTNIENKRLFEAFDELFFAVRNCKDEPFKEWLETYYNNKYKDIIKEMERIE